MKTTSEGTCYTFIRMIDNHAEANDDNFVGQIVLYALGINGFCMGFGKCKSKEGMYHLEWSTGDGGWYHMVFSRSEIEKALIEHEFKYTIEVKQKK